MNLPKLSVFQTVLLAVFGALAISGVLIFALVVGGGAGKSLGPVTIWGTFEESTFHVFLEAAIREDKSLSQVTYVQKDEATYASELTEALAEGLGPDLFFLRQDYAMREAGKISPISYSDLSSNQFRDVFIEAADPYLGENGVL